MTDTTVTTETPTSTTPPPLANSTEARTPDGTIKDQSTTLTTTPSETKPSDTKTEPKTEPKTTGGAPETYADFTLPEGRTLTKESLADASKLFKELGLTQDQAQKALGFHLAEVAKLEGGAKTTYDTMNTNWRNEVIKDTTIGNGTDGLSKEAAENIGRLKDSLGPELRGKFETAMNLTGAGNHPDIIRALNGLAKFVVEGKHVAGNGPSELGQKAPETKRPDAASALWPNNPRG